MKLDRDGSGSIDKDEFLQIPAIANNPLALRMIAIFDEEYVGCYVRCNVLIFRVAGEAQSIFRSLLLA